MMIFNINISWVKNPNKTNKVSFITNSLSEYIDCKVNKSIPVFPNKSEYNQI